MKWHTPQSPHHDLFYLGFFLSRSNVCPSLFGWLSLYNQTPRTLPGTHDEVKVSSNLSTYLFVKAATAQKA
jgi:hypothetical protein